MPDLEVEDSEWVEHSLIDFERKRCISKVLSLKWEAAVAKGNNYASDLFRLKLKVVLHSGEVTDRSVIYKALPSSQLRRIGMKKSGFFAKEAKVYEELLPTLEQIRKEKGDDGEPLAAKCFGVRRMGEGFLLEDLSVYGFKLADRSKGLDIHQAELAIKSLAKYHALGAVALERGDILPSEYGKWVFAQTPPVSLRMFSNCYVEFARVIKEKWPAEWKEYSESLLKFKDTFADGVVEDFKKIDDKFLTITHGDYWCNNMLFKFADDGTPKSIRLVDFQVASCSIPGADLHYMFQTSLQLGIMDKKPELLKTYYKSLIYYLEFFGYAAEKPTFQNIEGGYNLAGRYALGMGLAFRPLMMCTSSGDAPDMEEVAKKMAETQVLSMTRYDYEDQDYLDTMRYILRDAKSNGLL